jgi:hypothetical protein
VDAYLRLYWLLALYPELDAGQPALAWLFQAARVAGWSASIAELICREVRVDPEQGLGDAYRDLMENTGALPILLALTEWRWEAADRVCRWSQIPQDMERLRDKMRAEGEDAWARLLHEGLNHLAWATAEECIPAAAHYFEEVKGLEHLHGRLGQFLDQLEFLRETSGAWHELRKNPQAPAEVLALVPLCWLRLPGETRPRLMKFLEELVRDPRGWLAKLDVVAERAPGLISYLGSVISGLPQEAMEDNRSGELMGGVLGSFLIPLQDRDYRTLRKKILDFCLREAVPPWVVASVCPGHAVDQLTAPPLSQLIQGDWSLRFVFVAHQVFWACA